MQRLDRHRLGVRQPEPLGDHHLLRRRHVQATAQIRPGGRRRQRERLAAGRHPAAAHLLAERGHCQLLRDLRLTHERAAAATAHQITLADELVERSTHGQPRHAEVDAQLPLRRESSTDARTLDQVDHALAGLALLRRSRRRRHLRTWPDRTGLSGGGQYQLVVKPGDWYYSGPVDTRVEPITEARTEEHADLDLRTTRELVELLNDEDAKVPGAVRFASHSLAAAIDAIVERLQRGGRLVYVGAGSSGRLAVVDAAECGPTFGLAPGRVLAIMAGGAEAFAAAQEAAEDDVDTGGIDLGTIGVGAVDAVVAISASGTTSYVLGAARAARDAGALTVGVICAEGSELGRLVDHEIVAVVGPEVIAGSSG